MNIRARQCHGDRTPTPETFAPLKSAAHEIRCGAGVNAQPTATVEGLASDESDANQSQRGLVCREDATSAPEARVAGIAPLGA